VSFSGSQHGLTNKQEEELLGLLRQLKPELGIHGACIGGDDIFDKLCVMEGIDRLVFPSNHLAKRIPNQELLHRQPPRVTIRPPKQALDRNRDIITAGDVLIACPRQQYEIVRSGTWTTIRAAKKVGMVVYILKP